MKSTALLAASASALMSPLGFTANPNSKPTGDYGIVSNYQTESPTGAFVTLSITKQSHFDTVDQLDTKDQLDTATPKIFNRDNEVADFLLEVMEDYYDDIELATLANAITFLAYLDASNDLPETDLYPNGALAYCWREGENIFSVAFSEEKVNYSFVSLDVNTDHVKGFFYFKDLQNNIELLNSLINRV